MAKDKTTIRVIRSTDKPEREAKAPKKAARPVQKGKPAKASKVKAPKLSRAEKKAARASKKLDKKANGKQRKPAPKWLRTLAKPFAATGRYFKLSWVELKQVRWPNRRTTWKLTFMVIAYCIIFAVLIMLLDALFQFIFNRALA